MDNVRPWAARQKDLEEAEGAYSDYAAFEEWMTEKTDQACSKLHAQPDGWETCPCEKCFLFRLWELAEPFQKIELYTVFCACADETEKNVRERV